MSYPTPNPESEGEKSLDRELSGSGSHSYRSRKQMVWSKFWRIGVGTGLVLAGIAMCVLPGPGVLTIVAGLAVMAPEVPIAERIMDRLKDKAQAARDEIERKRAKRAARKQKHS